MGRSLVKPLIALAAFVVALTAVSAGSGGPAGPFNHPRGELVFGATRDPVVLDGALVSDGESLRPIRQIFETLVTLRPGTFKVIPELATRWRKSRDGKTWTFTLRRGVRFHDGTAFNAAAVCFNFNRWYNFSGPFQLSNASYYWQKVFKGFRRNERPTLRTSLYRGCRALNRYTVRILLRSPSGQLPDAFTLPALSIASPTALRRYGADEGEVRAGSFRPTGSYGFEHPTGTGPFRFQSWTRGQRLVLVRNERYWGKRAHVRRLIFRPISSNAARLQAVQTGEILGGDHMDLQDVPQIRRDRRLRLVNRPMFNIGYVGINQAMPPMNNPLVRQAVAYGLDRRSVVRAFYAGRGIVAHAFMPPNLFGYAKNVKKYSFQPERARQLLRRAGLRLPVRVEFWYPTGVSRPYMPDPRRNFEGLAASLERSGFDVVPRAAPWSPEYLGACQTGRCQLYLLGWTGDFGHPHNFIGTFFAQPDPAWNHRSQALYRLLARGEQEPNRAKQRRIYQQANRLIMQILPGVPYVHSTPALAFRRNVRGYIASPVSLEPFSLVSVGGT